MKVALVTGGSRGIGRGITRRLLADGYAVSVLATRPAPPELLVDLRAGLDDPGRVRYLQGDVVDPTTHARYLDDAADAWGRLDLLVNNAGVAPAERTDLLAATPESFDRVLGINLKGPYFLTQAFANRVLALTPEWAGDPPRATVVNVSSISATAVSTNRGEYCVSKAGVAMATQLFAVRLAPLGLVVYEVRPGVIATEMTAGVRERYDALFADGLAPMPRWGQPEDVAGAVSMLASGNTPYSTGEVFHVDGGMHIPVL
jgi:NAD(P)-dependent dehydrogenase (short-subunit alcohol dehydrogenase family)